MSGNYDAIIRSVLNSTQRQAPEPELDWTDRIMKQWERIPANREGAGDFPNAEIAGMNSHQLLEGANPREVIDPNAIMPTDLAKIILRGFK